MNPPILFEQEYPEEAKILQEVVLPRFQKWPKWLAWWEITDFGVKVKFRKYPPYFPQRNKSCPCGSGQLLRFCCEFLLQ